MFSDSVFMRVGGESPTEIELAMDLNWVVAGLGFNGNPAQFCEAIDASFSAETTVARFPDSAERHLRLVMNGRPVNMADARIDLTRDAQAPRRIAGEHCGREAISSVV